MKKLFALLFAVLLGFSLVACDDSSGKYTVDIFIYKFSDTYIASVRAALVNELNGFDNLDFNVHDADEKQDRQLAQIDAAIAKGTNLLVVNIVETESGAVVTDKAKAAGLPLIFFNREVKNEIVNSYDKSAFIGTDPDEAGYLQGELISDLLLAEGAFEKYDRNNDGVISYIMLRADLDNPEANGRTKYSVQEANRLLVLAGKPELRQIGADTNAGWDLAKAKTATSGFLTSNPFDSEDPIELIIANNDDMALGAIQALNEVGFNRGSDPDKTIIVVGVDATATAQDAIQSGKMSGSIKQDGEAMAKCIAAFIANSQAGKGYLEGTSYQYESGVNKVRIPYAKYTG